MSTPNPDDFGSETLDEITTQAEDAFEASKNYLRENPVPVIVGALLVGAALGFLFAPRERSKPKDTAEAARELLDTVYNEISDKLPRLKKQAVEAKCDLVDQVQDFGKKLKWW